MALESAEFFFRQGASLFAEGPDFSALPLPQKKASNAAQTEDSSVFLTFYNEHDFMNNPLLRTALLALVLAVTPLAALGAESAYPGEFINGKWIGISGQKMYDVQAGKSTAIDMEGGKEETELKIVSDDGETVVFTDDGLQYTATRNADGSLHLVMKGREKFPLSFKRTK